MDGHNLTTVHERRICSIVLMGQHYHCIYSLFSAPLLLPILPSLLHMYDLLTNLPGPTPPKAPLHHVSHLVSLLFSTICLSTLISVTCMTGSPSLPSISKQYNGIVHFWFILQLISCSPKLVYAVKSYYGVSLAVLLIILSSILRRYLS